MEPFPDEVLLHHWNQFLVWKPMGLNTVLLQVQGSTVATKISAIVRYYHIIHQMKARD